eukprot:jgi/Mesen1/6357/ME000328S05648
MAAVSVSASDVLLRQISAFHCSTSDHAASTKNTPSRCISSLVLISTNRNSYDAPKKESHGINPLWPSCNAVPPVRCGGHSVSHIESREDQSTDRVLYRRVTDVVTATRVTTGGDFVRVMGPGIDKPSTIGRVLAVDEFFLAPPSCSSLSQAAETLSPAGAAGGAAAEGPLEYLVYYLQESSSGLATGGVDDEGGSGGAEDDDGDGAYDERQPRHGVQIHLASTMRLVPPAQPVGGGGTAPGVLTRITHVKEAASVPRFSIADCAPAPAPAAGGGHASGAAADPPAPGVVSPGHGEKLGGRRGRGAGEGFVRVVAGECNGVKSPPPLTDFLVLDVDMRPGCTADLPLPPACQALVYVIEVPTRARAPPFLSSLCFPSASLPRLPAKEASD